MLPPRRRHVRAALEALERAHGRQWLLLLLLRMR